MARGQNISKETEYQIMTAYALNPTNVSAAARAVGVPESTARKVIGRCKPVPEYAELCEQKKAEFARKASEVIELALTRLRKELKSQDKIPVSQLSTVIGTLYDKRALAEGTATNRIDVSSTEIDKLAELAGYVRFRKDEDHM